MRSVSTEQSLTPPSPACAPVILPSNSPVACLFLGQVCCTPSRQVQVCASKTRRERQRFGGGVGTSITKNCTYPARDIILFHAPPRRWRMDAFYDQKKRGPLRWAVRKRFAKPEKGEKTRAQLLCAAGEGRAETQKVFFLSRRTIRGNRREGAKRWRSRCL